MHLYHFLMSLGWLAAIVAVLYLYLCIPYVLFLYIRWYRALRRERKPVRLEWTREAGSFVFSVWRGLKVLKISVRDFGVSLRKSLHPAAEDVTAWPPSFVQTVDLKRLRWLALFAFCVCLGVYAEERKHWMGSGCAHRAAKEYFVVGQVLNVLRHIETARRHPEAPDLLQLARLQWAIYRRGEQLLPADDGESACWQTMWFHSHYYKRGRRQLGLKRWETSPEMRALLDQWWDSLEILGTRPMADKRMLEEQALRNYPALAFQYLRHVGYYAEYKFGSAQRLAMKPEHVERFRRLSDWLWVLLPRWRKSPNSIAFLKKHPEVVALQQVALLLVLKALIQGEIHERKFDCANASVKRYISMRTAFVDPKTSAYMWMQDRQQAQVLYDIVIDGTGARSTKYIISEYCGVEVAGKEKNNITEYIVKAKNHNSTVDKEARASARSNYYEEDQILKEQFKKQ